MTVLTLIAPIVHTDESIISELKLTEYGTGEEIVDKMLFPDVEDTDTPQGAADKRKNELTES